MITEGEFKYTRKTPAELEELAWDVVSGKVFGSWMIPGSPVVSFMPLALLGPEESATMQKLEIIHCYEYKSEAGPVAANGMPIFMSVRFLDRTDATTLSNLCKDINDMKKKRLAEAEKR